MAPDRPAIVSIYERYLRRCNEHRFEALGEFVSDQVGGSGTVDGLTAYIGRLETVSTGFPDYQWQLEDLVVERGTIAARLTGRGTHTGPFCGIAPTGRSITVQELVVHRFEEGKIVRCWGDFFAVVRDAVTVPASALTEY